MFSQLPEHKQFQVAPPNDWAIRWLICGLALGVFGCHASGSLRSSGAAATSLNSPAVANPGNDNSGTQRVAAHLERRATTQANNQNSAKETTDTHQIVANLANASHLATTTSKQVERNSPTLTVASPKHAAGSAITQGPDELPYSDEPATTAGSTLATSTESPTADSLAYFEQTAIANHPGLQELQEQLAALEGKWLQVGLRPNTDLGFSGQQLFSNGTAEQMGLFIGQQIVRQPKLDWNRQVVCRELEVVQQQYAAQLQRILTDVRQNFYQVLIAQRRVAILEQLAGIADQAVTAAESLQRAGEGTQIDVLRASVERQATQVELSNARNSLTASWNRFAAVLGTPDLPAKPLSGELLHHFEPLDLAAYREQLQSQSPEIMAAIAEQERAQAAWQRAQVEALPDIDVQSVVQYDESFGGTNANLQVSMPIPWRDWNQGGIKQARSEWLAAQQAVQRVELGLQQRLANVYRDYENARQQVEAYQAPDGMIANSQRSLQLIDSAYRAGEISFLDLITAQRTNMQTNLLYLTSLEQYWNAHWEIQGLLLKGSLE